MEELTTDELDALFAATHDRDKIITELVGRASEAMLTDAIMPLMDDLAMVRSARRKIEAIRRSRTPIASPPA